MRVKKRGSVANAGGIFTKPQERTERKSEWRPLSFQPSQRLSEKKEREKKKKRAGNIITISLPRATEGKGSKSLTLPQGSLYPYPRPSDLEKKRVLVNYFLRRGERGAAVRYWWRSGLASGARRKRGGKKRLFALFPSVAKGLDGEKGR